MGPRRRDDGAVDDDAYVERLLAILTNPHPTGIDPADPYGQADDGIDRYDGFGRDVRVEAISVADGEHGAEIVVGFELRVPWRWRLRRSPRQGTVRLPLDREWLELSGYLDPAAYAPVVAREVEHAALGLVARSARVGADSAPPALPDRDEQWQALLGELSSSGAVRELAPGRIEVREPEGATVTVVVSPEQWEQVLRGRVSVDEDLEVLLGSRQEDETFVVFYRGDLVLSTREKLPPVRSRWLEDLVAEARRADPDATFGWYAHPTRPPEDEPGA